MSADVGHAPENELELARRALHAGNEGRARVCARRAAGWALADHYRRSSGGPASANALRMLRKAEKDLTLPVSIRQAATRLATKVDASFRLPFENDPIADAEAIIRSLPHSTGRHPGDP